MSEEKECNQVLKGLCNCKCVKNGTYPCFIEKEFLLKQQLQTAKEDAERYRQEANNASELAQKNLDKYFKAKEENENLTKKVRNQSLKITDLYYILSENEHYIKVECPKEFEEIVQENRTLTQQNKHLEVSKADLQSKLLKMKEALEKIVETLSSKTIHTGYEWNALCTAKQALKVGE